MSITLLGGCLWERVNDKFEPVLLKSIPYQVAGAVRCSSCHSPYFGFALFTVRRRF